MSSHAHAKHDGRFPAIHRTTGAISMMKGADAKVALAMATFNFGGEVYPGSKVLAEITGLSERSVKAARQRLCSLGVLSQTQAGGGSRSNRYRFVKPDGSEVSALSNTAATEHLPVASCDSRCEDSTPRQSLIAGGSSCEQIGADTRHRELGSYEPMNADSRRSEAGSPLPVNGNALPGEGGCPGAVKPSSPKDRRKTRVNTAIKTADAGRGESLLGSRGSGGDGDVSKELERWLIDVVRLSDQQAANLLGLDGITLAGAKRVWASVSNRKGVKSQVGLFLHLVKSGEAVAIMRPPNPAAWSKAIRSGEVVRTGSITWVGVKVGVNEFGLFDRDNLGPVDKFGRHSPLITAQELETCDYE